MRKLLFLALALVLMCFMVSCAQKNPENESKNEVSDPVIVEKNPQENASVPPDQQELVNAAVYDELIGRIYETIVTGNTESGELDGTFSLYAGLGHLNVSEMLTAAGYAVEDINADGIPELILGMVTKLSEGRAEGNIIYTLYTYADGEPVLVFESFARSSYSWLGDGKFHYYGSGGAANSGFGLFTLPAKGTELKCEEFWFSDVKPGTDTDIGYYHNTSGSWNAKESEELFISNAAFWEMETSFFEQGKDFTFTQFINYEKAEAIDMIDLWWETSTDEHLAAVAYLGYAESDLDDFKRYAEQMGILEKYPFIKNIDEEHAVLREGGEWYIVVPGEDVQLNGYDAIPVESVGTVMPGEELLLPATVEPVLIRCNVSEIYPNVMIGLRRNDEMPISYSPQLSMKDGALAQSENIFDFTPYQLFPQYLLEIVTDPDDPEYQYYSYRGENIATPVVGNEDPDPILVKALKNDLTIRIEMMNDEMLLAERMLMEGEVLFVSAELVDDESPLRIFASCENGQREGYWYAITDNGEKHYRELICGV